MVEVTWISQPYVSYSPQKDCMKIFVNNVILDHYFLIRLHIYVL